MKTLTEFNQALNDLEKARVILITASEKEIPDERLKKIISWKEIIDKISECGSDQANEVLFMRYLKAQYILQMHVEELKGIINEFARQNPKVENLPKISANFLPVYFLKYNAPTMDLYNDFLKKLAYEYSKIEMPQFMYEPNSEKLFISMVGYQPQAQEIVLRILKTNFSDYCKYELTPYRPNTPEFFNSSNSSTPNKINTTSTTPTLTSSDSENNKKSDPNLNFKL